MTAKGTRCKLQALFSRVLNLLMLGGVLTSVKSLIALCSPDRQRLTIPNPFDRSQIQDV
jgi:hypothetical protein